MLPLQERRVMARSTIIFEHIPKTAGSTVNSLLQRKYGSKIYHIESLHTLESIDRFRNFTEEKKRDYTLIRGHGASLLASAVENPKLFTFLRDPAERMLSQYNYLRTRDDHRSAEKARKYSLIDFLSYSKEMGEDNLMTRFLSGKLEATLGGKPEAVSNADLKEALERLSTFDHVFLVENFDTSLLQLKNWLNWKTPPFYGVENRSEGIRFGSLSALEVEAIRKCEYLDVALYEHVKKQMTARYEVSSQALFWFRIQNQMFNYIRSAYRVFK